MCISVALYTYKGEKVLKDQLNGNLVQIRQLDEGMACDDSTTDHTLEVLNPRNPDGLSRQVLAAQGLAGRPGYRDSRATYLDNHSWARIARGTFAVYSALL